jgi:hypothetical protein
MWYDSGNATKAYQPRTRARAFDNLFSPATISAIEVRALRRDESELNIVPPFLKWKLPLWLAVASALCLQGGCRRVTPIGNLWSDPKAWEGKKVAVHGLVSDRHVPESGTWSPAEEEEPGFLLTDTTGGCDDWVSVLTNGAVPAEGWWVRVEGVVRVRKEPMMTLEPTDGPVFGYSPVIVASSPWSGLRKHLDGLQLRLIELTERSRLLRRLFELAAPLHGVRRRGHDPGRRAVPTPHPRKP